MRKVKFTQDSFDEKLGAILEEFPIIDVSVLFYFWLFSGKVGYWGRTGTILISP